MFLQHLQNVFTFFVLLNCRLCCRFNWSIPKSWCHIEWDSLWARRSYRLFTFCSPTTRTLAPEVGWNNQYRTPSLSWFGFQASPIELPRFKLTSWLPLNYGLCLQNLKKVQSRQSHRPLKCCRKIRLFFHSRGRAADLTCYMRDTKM